MCLGMGRRSALASSSPLNWAFGCRKGHHFLLHILKQTALRILQWKEETVSPTIRPFCATVLLQSRTVFVDVLHLTGPALVEHALAQFAFGNETVSLIQVWVVRQRF
mmetsp:Transcript_13186/g.15093  ORF Transcript_13186/g.15093 Transcript_13186/m.15093 type:complete len:107 (-) Transcript_13186:644-964(-)